VRIIANSAVVDRINKVYQEKIDKWKNILVSGATSHAVAIEKVDGYFIEFESSRIEVLKNIQGDTDENTMLWIPEQRILIAGDVLFNNMHVYTAETDSGLAPSDQKSSTSATWPVTEASRASLVTNVAPSFSASTT